MTECKEDKRAARREITRIAKIVDAEEARSK